MAKINNSAVVQKLIDELELSPAKDLIPTELADKILPVYQINTEEITIKTSTANVVRTVPYATLGEATSAIIYTTPATGKFYLTNLNLAYTGLVSQRQAWISIIVGGVTYKIANINVPANGYRTVPLNFHNPVLIDPATEIKVNVSSGAGGYCDAEIYGYTETE